MEEYKGRKNRHRLATDKQIARCWKYIQCKETKADQRPDYIHPMR